MGCFGEKKSRSFGVTILPTFYFILSGGVDQQLRFTLIHLYYSKQSNYLSLLRNNVAGENDWLPIKMIASANLSGSAGPSKRDPSLGPFRSCDLGEKSYMLQGTDK